MLLPCSQRLAGRGEQRALRAIRVALQDALPREGMLTLWHVNGGEETGDARDAWQEGAGGCA